MRGDREFKFLVFWVFFSPCVLKSTKKNFRTHWKEKNFFESCSGEFLWFQFTFGRWLKVWNWVSSVYLCTCVSVIQESCVTLCESVPVPVRHIRLSWILKMLFLISLERQISPSIDPVFPKFTNVNTELILHWI